MIIKARNSGGSPHPLFGHRLPEGKGLEFGRYLGDAEGVIEGTRGCACPQIEGARRKAPPESVVTKRVTPEGVTDRGSTRISDGIRARRGVSGARAKAGVPAQAGSCSPHSPRERAELIHRQYTSAIGVRGHDALTHSDFPPATTAPHPNRRSEEHTS